MKTQLLKSIIFYLLTTIFYLLKADAQIVYTDVSPDTTITTGGAQIIKTYGLDLNNDGTVDFNILTSYHRGIYGVAYLEVMVTPLNANKVLDSLKGSIYYPAALVVNSYVGANLVWRDDSNQTLKFCRLYTSSSYEGLWSYNTDAYLGLKVIIGSDTFYGWVRLSIHKSNSASSFTIKDYAYNSIPNQPILAGEISCATPIVTLSASGMLSFCAGDSVTLTVNGTGYLYQWKKNNFNISGATSKKYTAKTAGIYKCKVTNSCGSKTSGTRTVTVPCRDASFLSMTNTEVLEHFSVFPNPANNSVTIKFPSDEEGTVQIINLFGEIVETHRIVETDNYPSLNEMQIDVSRFSAGMYVVRWNSGEGLESDSYRMKKFSVVR